MPLFLGFVVLNLLDLCALSCTTSVPGHQDQAARPRGHLRAVLRPSRAPVPSARPLAHRPRPLRPFCGAGRGGGRSNRSPVRLRQSALVVVVVGSATGQVLNLREQKGKRPFIIPGAHGQCKQFTA